MRPCFVLWYSNNTTQTAIKKINQISLENDKMKGNINELRETLNTIMRCRDLWGVPDGKIPIEHRGEYAVLRAMEVNIIKTLEKTKHYEQI